MQAAEILDTFKKLGITAYVKGDKLVCEPGSKLPPDLKPEIREHRAELMALLLFQPTLQTEAPYIRLDQAQPGEIDLPFPLGNGGLDSKQVEMAERHNTRLGVVDPVERRLNVLFWLMQHYQEVGNSDMATQVKTAYKSLRDATPDVVALVRIGELSQETLLKRLRNGQHWLTQEHEKWLKNSPGAATDADFQKALDGWVAMETQLRERHSYQGCIHGEGGRCPDDAAVSCDACLKNIAESQKGTPTE